MRRGRAVGQRRPASVASRGGGAKGKGLGALGGSEGVAKEVTRLLDEIRSVDVEWPVVQPADEYGSRVERLQREEKRLAAELRAMEGERQELEAEQESVEAQKLEAVPYQEDVAELKAEIRRLQGVVANAALAQETVDLLTEEQELLATQLEQAEHRSHILVAKAEELASLVMEEAERGGALGQDSLEVELKRVLAEAEAAHDTVDACKVAVAEQKQALARSQLELVDAKDEAQRAQVELKDGHHELLVASREAADVANAARKRQEDLSLRMDELQDRKLQVGAKKVKITERIQAELKAIAEAKAISAQVQEEEAEEMVRLEQEAKERRRREELARAKAVREKQKRASSGIPAPAYQAPAHTPRRKPAASTTPKRKPADSPGSPASPRPVPRSPATRIPLAAALEAAAHEEYVPKTAGGQVVKAHLDEAKAMESPRTPSRQKLPQRLAGSASATPSRQNLPARLSTAKKSERKGDTGSAHATVPQLVMPDHAARAVLFDSIDVNGNGGLSLAEVDKAVVSGLLGNAMHCPDFDHKPALMRAYHAADVSHDGFIERSEFKNLLKYLVYFNNMWHKFEEIDSDHDRRLNADEFAHGCRVLGIDVTPEEATAEFERCDTDGGGMVLFIEFCKWAADRHVDSDVVWVSESEAEAAQAAKAEGAIRKQKEAEFAQVTRMERRRQDLTARTQAIEPREKRLEASQKSVKQERDALERQRKTLRRKNAALLKQERQLREERKEVVKAQKKLRKLRENRDKLEKASQVQTKDAKVHARNLKEKLAKLDQAETLQSSLVSEEHEHLADEMAQLREARVRFHAERREAEEGLRAVCEAAGVEWTMRPLPTPTEEETLAAAQQAEMEERRSRLQALLTVASAPTVQGGVQSDGIDYDEEDGEDDDAEEEDGEAGMSVVPGSSKAAGDEIDYDEDDADGDTEDDEAEMSVGASAFPASSAAAGDAIDYDEEGGDTEDDEAEMAVGASALPASSAAAGDAIDYDDEDEGGETEDDEINHAPAPQTAAALGPTPARAAPLLNSDSDSSTEDDEGDFSSGVPRAPPQTAVRQQDPEFNSDSSSSDEDV